MTHPNLARIEATLNRLPEHSLPDAPPAGSQMDWALVANSGQHRFGSYPSPVSFQIGLARSPVAQSTKAGRSPQLMPTQNSAPATQAAGKNPLHSTPAPAVRPFTPATPTLTGLALPKFKLPHFTQHQNSFNMALPMSLVKRIETQIESWQVELRHILAHIQALYAEGPIVNGWLDPVSAKPASPSVTLHNAETADLLAYVDEICQAQPPYPPTSAPATAPVTDYQLCGLHADGRVWCRPCPPEQIPTISLAIARYRQLRMLLQQKEQLELCLQQSAAALVEVQSYLQRLTAAV